MILFGVMGDDVVDPLHPKVPQMPDQFGGFRRIDRIDQGGFLLSPDQIGIVRGAVGKGDQFVKQPTVPIDGPDGEYILLDFSGRHLPSYTRVENEPKGTGSDRGDSLGRFKHFLSGPADRTYPGLGQIIEGSTGLHPGIGISGLGVIDITADGTDITFHRPS
jgi:hypothetical protein